MADEAEDEGMRRIPPGGMAHALAWAANFIERYAAHKGKEIKPETALEEVVKKLKECSTLTYQSADDALPPEEQARQFGIFAKNNERKLIGSLALAYAFSESLQKRVTPEDNIPEGTQEPDQPEPKNKAFTLENFKRLSNALEASLFMTGEAVANAGGRRPESREHVFRTKLATSLNNLLQHTLADRRPARGAHMTVSSLFGKAYAKAQAAYHGARRAQEAAGGHAANEGEREAGRDEPGEGAAR